ncbi:IclR family transcriptional regulator [Psychromarinibacter sp. C21-152]|uniref:IclR family transcriptional regulator n=1 Tax=Psychromarinibacter sediminicola TaxID=3033385 RepID=A0AAE3NZ03_9RHOB|nr:IclR family transcriptional regulator [Psychromarinibacter sediminicola]MDF0603302.1 IclR family transcriptional regulator [Psychromarinibacter sediminicola]
MGIEETRTEPRRARGLDRAFEILDFLRAQRQPMRPNEIAQIIGAPRSSVYELVNVLLRLGVIEYRGSDGRVFLGRKLYFLGAAYMDELDLIQAAESVLTEVTAQIQETSQLCMLDGNKYTVALMRESARPFRISSTIGEAVPLPWTASGRLLVSHMTDDEIRDFIPPEDFVLPDAAPLDPDEFLRQVRQAETDGHFTFNSEVERFAHCFAVPVRDGAGICAATLCLVTPEEDGRRNHDHYLDTLKRGADQLSFQLGPQSSATEDAAPARAAAR